MPEAGSSVIPPLAVTMGDPAGIGPDIALMAWAGRKQTPVPPFALYVDLQLLVTRGKALGLDIAAKAVESPAAAAGVFEAAFPIIETPLAAPALAGTPDERNAAAVISAIERAVADVRGARASAVVTCPIAKSVLSASGFAYPGHTEFLGALAGRHWPGAPAEPVMMLACDSLRVVPATIHVPLSAVPKLITAELVIGVTRITHAALKSDFGFGRPRIAVAGLNPHAGEHGMLGSEEEAIIIPALERLRGEGIDASGPHSADTMFHAAARARYDAAIAMYHDQALIPIKTLAFDEGVNVTLGLPFVRTSPDHGTAFSIAGKGTASPSSFIAALRLAARMAARRMGIAAS